jgi:hypothetical protein
MIERIISFFREIESKSSIFHIKNWRVWFIIIILSGALLILMTPLFADLNIPSFTEKNIIVPEIQRNAAFEGVHFLGGMILGYAFSHPAVGLTFGIMKETVDWIRFAYTGRIYNESPFKSFMDIVFWASGGYVGYYLLANIHVFLHKRDIRGFKDLAEYSVKKVSDSTKNNKIK